MLNYSRLNFDIIDYYHNKSPQEINKIRQKLIKIKHTINMADLFLYDPDTQNIYVEAKNKSNILTLRRVRDVYNELLELRLHKYVNKNHSFKTSFKPGYKSLEYTNW
jgi:hypothetical protein